MLKVKTLKKITKKIESVPGTDKNFDLIVNKVYEEINAKNLSDDDREVVVEWWALTADFCRETSKRFDRMPVPVKNKIHNERMADVVAYVNMHKNF